MNKISKMLFLSLIIIFGLTLFACRNNEQTSTPSDHTVEEEKNTLLVFMIV